MLYHYSVDPILYGVSQVSNKKLYFFDNYGAQLWDVFKLSLSNINVYNYCVNQLFIQTTWGNAIGERFECLLDYLIQKNDKFGHSPIDIYIFLFHNGPEVKMTEWLRVSKRLPKWIKLQSKLIKQNKLIKSFKFGIKNYALNGQEFIIDVKKVTKDWEQGVTRVFDDTNIPQTEAEAHESLVEAEWEKLVKLIYDEC